MDPLNALASFFLGLIKQGKMEKWYSLTATCMAGAFVGFFGTLGTSGWILLAAGNSPLYSLVGGFFSACSLMATVVYLSVKRSGLLKDLVLPRELENIVANSDIVKPEPLPSDSDAELRKVLR